MAINSVMSRYFMLYTVTATWAGNWLQSVEGDVGEEFAEAVGTFLELTLDHLAEEEGQLELQLGSAHGGVVGLRLQIDDHVDGHRRLGRGIDDALAIDTLLTIESQRYLAHRGLDGNGVLTELDCIKMLTSLALNFIGMLIKKMLDE